MRSLHKWKIKKKYLKYKYVDMHENAHSFELNIFLHEILHEYKI